jgi:hypothetical protein
VAVTNVGKIPAQNVSVSVKLTTAPDRSPELSFVEDTEIVHRVIQPSASIRQGSGKYLPTTEYSPDTKLYVYIHGVAYYGDGFGQRRFTRFCHRYDVTSYDHDWRRSDNADRMIVRPDKARYHTEGNEAD